MKIPSAVSMVALVIVALLVTAILRKNDIASYGQKSYGYAAFNWSKPGHPATIMAYWKKKPERVDAVKSIVLLDYALMLVYCVYLCWSIQYHRRRPEENRHWLKTWLAIGFWAVLLGTVIDAIQDYKIYHYVTSEDPVGDMRYYTWIKWGALLLGILPLVIALLPRDILSIKFAARSLRFLSQLLKSIWVFFPGVLFLLFPIFCFWVLGQGKDIIVAFIDNHSLTKSDFYFNYFRLIFFVAIGFWVYVSWYSSRIISYIKRNQQLQLQEKAGINKKHAELEFDEEKPYFEIGKDFLDEIPRIIGNSCFLILELAVLQSPVLYSAISSTEAWIFFFLSLIILLRLNRWITKSQADGPTLQEKRPMVERASFRKTFWILLSIFIVLTVVSSFFGTKGFSIWVLFALLLLFHVVFIFYINLRRVEMEKNAHIAKVEAENETKESRSLLKRSMDFFCIPRKETGYYRWFLRIGAIGIIFYILAICWLGFARELGPFPSIILSFGVLLSFGNAVTAISVRYRVNFHFLLFLLALLFGLRETHEVRTIDLKGDTNRYESRPDLRTYLSAWLENKNIRQDTCYDVYFVMSNGGASRSGYWTAAVLGKIEDSSIVHHPGDRFSDHVFCLSGTSGGGVGVATFFSLLRKKNTQIDPRYAASARAYLRQDYFTYTFARMLGPDFFNYIFHFSAAQDRAAALESSFETSSTMAQSDSVYEVPFADPLSSFPAMNGGRVQLPILFVNTTRMQDGNPGVVTNLNLSKNKDVFNSRVDVVDLLPPGKDISITSGAILGARFPYLSPAGKIAKNYFVDGGYFDNSGAGVVQEIIRGILKIAKEDTSLKLREQIKRLNFKILHIVNSPVGFESDDMQDVAPIKNDLMSPILTIAGAYDKQTTVNDGRLTSYISDINKFEPNRASYTQVSLYESKKEWWYDPLNRRFRGEPPYAMNWFMSDTTVSRINKRLNSNWVLDSLIRDFEKLAVVKVR